MIVYFFFLLITVSLGRCDTGCVESYMECGELAQQMKGAPPCRIVSAFMKCVVNTTEICAPSLTDTVKKYQILINDGCRPGSSFFRDVGGAMECIMNENDPFHGCKLEGEFNNVAEVCLSVENVIECARLRTEAVCGRKASNAFSKLWGPIIDLLSDCQNSQEAKDYELDACYKGLLNCDRQILTRHEYTCLDVEKTARCYVDVADAHCDLEEEDQRFIRIIRKYVDQIPDYCNPHSAVMQSFKNSGDCMLSKQRVLDPCNERFVNAMYNLLEHHYESKESTIVRARSAVEYRDCAEKKLRSVCNDDAAFVVRYAMEPIVAVADDTCMKLTGETCNGAFRMKCTILLLMLCLKYLLTKEEE